ncbi:MAG TPA: class I SAM-dependent methyltransferase [Bdellovibrionota bacterium]|jgi:SAM-dependent methyltransferase
MIEFHEKDPFPLVGEIIPELYADSKRHAASVDDWLGLAVEKIESRLADPKDGAERWIGRHSSVFLTPYVELRAWLEELKPKEGSTVVDLGAGYGRLGFVLARHFPEVKFLGFELVPERVREGTAALARFKATNASLEEADLSLPSWKPPVADIYFIYDYGSPEAVRKTLEDLKHISNKKGIIVVGRGRGVRDKIEKEHPWLGSVYGPVHRAHYSIYRSFG